MEKAAMSSPRVAPQQESDQRRFFSPPVDVLENKDELLVLVDVPGVIKENLTIGIDKD